MDATQFWHVIGTFDWSQEGDDEAVIAPAVAALADRSEEEIQAFSDLLAGFLYALDTREHARYGFLGEADPDNGDDYISADAFLYLRCVVVANGREFYEAVLADPTRMPKGDLEFESLLSVDSEAYLAKTGEDYDYLAEPSYESFSNAEGWAPAGGRAGRFTGDDVPPMNRRPL